MAKALREILIEKTPDIEQNPAMPPEKAKERKFIELHDIKVHGDLPWKTLNVPERKKLEPDAGKKEELKKIREFVEEEFDTEELTEEQVEELITEISKKLAGSYVKNAAADTFAHGYFYKKGGKENESSLRKGLNRVKGIGKASDRLTKEELEDVREFVESEINLEGFTEEKAEELITEISKKLAQSYLDKSKAPVSIVPKEDKRSFIPALQARRSNRFKGRQKAEKIVAKEEVEQIDEAHSTKQLKQAREYHYNRSDSYVDKRMERKSSLHRKAAKTATKLLQRRGAEDQDERD